jgi:hypothetical protein
VAAVKRDRKQEDNMASEDKSFEELVHEQTSGRMAQADGTDQQARSRRRLKCKALMLGLLAPLALAFGGCSAPNSNSDIVCDPNGCMSLSKLTNNINNALANNVTGYVAVVGDSLGGGLPLAGGLARTATDGSILSMNFRLLTNFASVAKLMTTIAVLKSLSAHNLTLDTKINGYIYPDWPRGPNIGTITFRDLLSHTSGFRDSCGATAYSDLKAQIRKGVDTTLIGKAQYCNGNFAIFREILPVMEGQIIPPETDPFGNPIRAGSSAAFYINYVNQHVFAPLQIPARDCKPPPSGTDYILSYPLPAGSSPGINWGDGTLQCGAGNWWLSGDDVFKVVNDIARGKVLLTASEKALMIGSTPTYIGWDNTVRGDCPSPNLCKNGGLEHSDGRLIPTQWSIATYASIFKCVVPVVVIVNSTLPPPQPQSYNSDPIPLVEKAYQGALTNDPPRPCP